MVLSGVVEEDDEEAGGCSERRQSIGQRAHSGSLPHRPQQPGEIPWKDGHGHAIREQDHVDAAAFSTVTSEEEEASRSPTPELDGLVARGLEDHGRAGELDRADLSQRRDVDWMGGSVAATGSYILHPVRAQRASMLGVSSE